MKVILVQTKMDGKTFKIEVGRKGSNIDEVEGTDY